MIDEDLRPNSSFLRLWKEYETYKSLVIAYDLDNTVYDFHKKGETHTMVMELLRELKKVGCYMICFTANDNLDFVRNYLYTNDIPFDVINENPPFFKGTSRKIYFNALLDDRAGLQQVYNELHLLVNIIKTNKK